jgi:hypothetical protein
MNGEVQTTSNKAERRATEYAIRETVAEAGQQMGLHPRQTDNMNEGCKKKKNWLHRLKRGINQKQFSYKHNRDIKQT